MYGLTMSMYSQRTCCITMQYACSKRVTVTSCCQISLSIYRDTLTVSLELEKVDPKQMSIPASLLHYMQEEVPCYETNNEDDHNGYLAVETWNGKTTYDEGVNYE